MTDYERDMNRERIARIRAERRREEKCPECGGCLDGRHKRCFSCRAKNAAYQERWRKKQLEGAN